MDVERNAGFQNFRSGLDALACRLTGYVNKLYSSSEIAEAPSHS